MEITSFDVTADHMVTLHMSDMPKVGVRPSNTRLFIAGVPVGDPELEIRGKDQEIEFFAGSATQSGKISVMVSMETGELSAESGEDYTIEEPDTTHQPVLTNISPRSTSPGAQVTVRGRTLKMLEGVALGTEPKIRNLTAITETSARFMIPVTTKPGTYALRIWSRNDSGPKPTSVRIEIVKEGD